MDSFYNAYRPHQPDCPYERYGKHRARNSIDGKSFAYSRGAFADDVIAPDLLRRKFSQQLFLTSHNANLVVLTDADLIVHMDSDGRTGTIVSAGFLACPKSKVRNSVIDVLDGGASALDARKRKYGDIS